MIGKLLGHTTVHMTARYAHPANDPLKSAADHIANGIADIAGQLTLPTGLPPRRPEASTIEPSPPHNGIKRQMMAEGHRWSSKLSGFIRNCTRPRLPR